MRLAWSMNLHFLKSDFSSCIYLPGIPGAWRQANPRPADAVEPWAAAVRNDDCCGCPVACLGWVMVMVRSRRHPVAMYSILSRTGKPRQQPLVQLFRRYRLGDVIVHAGVETGLPVLVEGVRGHGENRCGHGWAHPRPGYGWPGRPRCRSLPASACPSGSGRRRCAAPVRSPAGHSRPDRRQAPHPPAIRATLPARSVRLPPAGCARRQTPFAGAVLPSGPKKSALAGRRLVPVSLRGTTNQKVLPGPRRALDADLAAHQFDQPLADRQPESGAAVFSRHAVVGLLEGLEQSRLRLGVDADAGVADFEAHLHRIGGFADQAGAQGDAALPGELDGIADQVEQDLAQPQRIAPQEQARQFGRNVGFQAQAFSAALCPSTPVRLPTTRRVCSGASSSTMRSASILERSRMSLITPSR
jgi:hypothetical protein